MLIASLLIAAVAQPAPVYLRCAFPGGEILFTADEANSIVTMSVPKSGLIERFSSSFTADAVRFRDAMGPTDYAISRVNLTVKRTLAGTDVAEEAICKIEQPPKRAF